MKLLVSCDQVFDVLTRGPFPTGEASDEAVEQHLRACHDCRQLAEALRPAVSLLHEAVAGDQALNLPEYQGSLPALEYDDAHYTSPRSLALGMRRLDQRQGRRPHPRRSGSFDYSQLINGMRLMAASVLVVALGTLVWGLVLSAKNQGASDQLTDNRASSTSLPEWRGVPSTVAPVTGPNERGLLTLAKLNLEDLCFPPEPRLLAAADAGTSLQAVIADSEEALTCCTHCHAVGQSAATVQVAANTRFTQSCTACHRG